MSLSDALKHISHHAYAIIGPQTLRSDLLALLEKKHKIVKQANPDFFDRTYQTLTIDDAREVKSFHETKPFIAGSKKIFILTMDGITVEAQNALLKLLEEPADYAHFFLIIPSAHLLLPTVKSRLMIIAPEVRPQEAQQTADLSEAKNFLKASQPKRLEIIKDLLDEISDEKKTKQSAIDFLNDIEQALYEEKGVKKATKSLEAIEHARKYMNDRAPSMKMLLEHVALNI